MEKFIVLDTETTNSIDDPLCYDIGFIVTDIDGRIYEKHSYVVADIFLDKELMSSAYFGEKIPQYWEDIKNGDRLLRRFITIKMIFRDICSQYNIKKVFAHNARFDYRSLTLTQRFLTSSKYRFFFPYGIEIWDSLKMSREVFTSDDYKMFCKYHGYVTKYNHPQYTAEVIYKYLTGDNDFIESHTGLEDVLIEKDICIYCLNEKKDIKGNLWG